MFASGSAGPFRAGARGPGVPAGRQTQANAASQTGRRHWARGLRGDATLSPCPQHTQRGGECGLPEASAQLPAFHPHVSWTRVSCGGGGGGACVKDFLSVSP